MSARIQAMVLGTALLAQWGVLGGSYWQDRQLLTHGAVYRFATVPVDPIDPFRGRYVQLHFAAQQLTLSDADADFAAGDRLYLPLSHNDAGQAQWGSPRRARPDHGDYLRARVQSLSRNEGGARVLTLTLPFDRYYMNETLAPHLETLLRGRNPPQAYAQVRILDGRARLAQLIVDGQDAETFVRARMAAADTVADDALR